jgi:threonylcarbamoyladenosine tRNA methylthiotransferase CDKAL1
MMEKICLKTFGCSLNYADSERIRAILEERGFFLTENQEEADIIIINSCAVKGPTESKFFTLLEKLSEKKVIVAGCIAQSMPEKLQDYSKIGPDQIDAIADVVDETIAGNIVSMIVQEPKNKLKMPASRKKSMLEIIPINQGCMGECSYCIVKRARGNLYSYPIKDIVETARNAVTKGAKEIWLTSQDTGCYGFDIGTTLADLLCEITKIQGDYMIRVGMMNPNHALKHLRELISAFKHPKIYKFLHLPLQSGNNFVLEDMKRHYLAEDFEHIINTFRKEIPDITISTDIIVGYPTEKEEFFRDSINAIKDIKPDVLNLTRFWPRPHTLASKLKMLPGNISKQRAIEMMQTFSWVAFEKNKKWIGWEGNVLINEKGKDNSFKGRNYAYKTIIINEQAEIGKHYTVKVIKVTKYDLIARIISKEF